MPHPVDPNCVFCKIVAGQIPCFKVYEDDVVLAFLDVGPIVNGHTLVIPKAHFAAVMDAPAGLLGAVSERLPKIAQAVLAATGMKACHILVNNGTDAMQSVPHLHYHILPRARRGWLPYPLAPKSIGKGRRGQSGPGDCAANGFLIVKIALLSEVHANEYQVATRRHSCAVINALQTPNPVLHYAGDSAAW